MDIMTILGFLAGISTVYYVLSDGNILHLLLNPVAFVLVFGGTFSATLIAYPWNILKHIVSAFRLMFLKQRHSEIDRQQLIEQMVLLSEKAKLSGVESTFNDIQQMKDPFLSYSMQMVFDGYETEVIMDNMEKRILYAHQHNHKINEPACYSDRQVAQSKGHC